MTEGDPPAALRSRRDGRGRFTNPWLDGTAERGVREMMRWQLQRMRNGRPADPAPGAFPLATPEPALPRTAPGELRITWVGHATFLVQHSGVNVLTDPVWSRRASPFSRFGPVRLTPPGMPLEQLPPIDAVVFSHDHYDHLDAASVRRLHATFGDDVAWLAPLGYARWFAGQGVRRITELDWWDDVVLQTPGGPLQVRALPAQHWTRRVTSPVRSRLWSAYSINAGGGMPVLFGGDSGYFPGYADIGRLAGPFRALLLPVGAYEPRWFMRDVHMNPEDAVQAYDDLGGSGVFVASHWGTFRLTDEDPLEPPRRLRAAWLDSGRPPGDLWIPRHGETRRFAGS